jgi:cellobiose transport system substrate-binding protein
MTPDGKNLIALPIDSAPTALFYREDIFKEAGLESDPEKMSATYKSWDDIYEAGKILQSKTKAKLFDNIDMVFVQSMAQQKDQLFDKSNNFIGDQAHVKACFDNAVKASKEGLLANIANWTPEWNAAMNNGDVAAFVGGVWMKGVLADSAPDTLGKWRIANTPGGPGNQGGSFISIPSSCKNPEAAWKVISWMMNAENQSAQYKKLGLFPSTVASFKDDSIYQPEEFFGGQITTKVFAECAENIPVFYIAPKHNMFRDFFSKQLLQVADQSKDPEQAWNDAVANAKQQLSK